MTQATALPHNEHDPRLELAALLKAAGDELRLSVLQILAQDSYGVLELAQALSTKQSGISHHLKVLANVGLVETRREGNSIFYRRATIAPDDLLAKTKQAIFQQVDQLPLNSEVAKALNDIWLERAEASRQFFLGNADKFKEQQDLIASFDSYGHQVAELLKLTRTPSNQRALEVGPGAGEFLPTLASLFTEVVALDNNTLMLEQAKLRASDYRNIDFRLDDTSSLAGSDQYDCAVMNMVLHHTPSPAQVIADVSASLKIGGAMLVTELCRHQQTWAREACGDIWLGFEQEDLNQWAAAANLKLGQSVYFALRNGFQIQIQQFFKN